jgi:hypothetical protein
VIVVLRSTALAAAVAVLGLLAAGCGGSPHAPSVASLGATSSTTTTGSATSEGAGSGNSTARGGAFSAGGGNVHLAIAGGSRSRMAAFSACMRSHGVPKFPDPQFPGGRGISIQIGPSTGIDPQSPQFQAAKKACQSDFPGPKGPPGAAAVAGGK